MTYIDHFSGLYSAIGALNGSSPTTILRSGSISVTPRYVPCLARPWTLEIDPWLTCIPSRSSANDRRWMTTMSASAPHGELSFQGLHAAMKHGFGRRRPPRCQLVFPRAAAKKTRIRLSYPQLHLLLCSPHNPPPRCDTSPPSLRERGCRMPYVASSSRS